MTSTLRGKYEIVQEIKKGGFGIVYHGIDTQLDKPVAIKEIAPTLLEDPKYLEMFQEEALNIAKLSHNNIVHIYEFFKSPDGRLYIVMEYIDGKDLEKIIRVSRRLGRRIPQHLAVHLMAEVCMALDYAHHRRDVFTNKPLNLVHQDISPSNIMISRFGGVKLIDFGIASVKRHQTKERKRQKLRGKVPYMAPEQLILGYHPDHRSDLFSLGLVLYEALTTTRLFKSQEEVIAAGKNHKWMKKAIKNSKLPAPLEKIMLKALAVDISERYQSANHMYIDLLQYLISCNETGELMDQLADYVQRFFSNTQPTTPNTPPPQVYRNHTEEPQPNSHNTLVPNRWEGENPPPKEESVASKPVQAKTPKVEVTSQFQSYPSEEVSEEEDDDIKTVIDVIRISARNHKKRLLQFAFALFLSLIIFGVFDTIKGWTAAGVWMYDWLFPPAIEIVTVPENAKILLDGEEVPGLTPLAIEKISPGVHKLELDLKGYKPIVKSLLVPRDGDIRVQGEQQKSARSYLFRFNTEIEIDSFPPGAEVYINNILYNQKTPCSFTWEIGKPLKIELARKGFERLSGYALNTLKGYDTVDDRRFWDMKVHKDNYTKYSVNGIFRKSVEFQTTPSDVEIYDAKTNALLGTSGKGNEISLTAGTFDLELRKRNFITKKITLTMDEDFDQTVTAVLSRRVQVRAFNELDGSRKDIGAKLVSLRRGSNNVLRNRRTTPFELTLPAYSYRAKFAKPGFEPAEMTLGPEQRLMQVEMSPLKAIVEVQVLDAMSNQPVSGADIYYRQIDNSETSDVFFDQTGPSGTAYGQLVQGNYTFEVRKPGFNGLERSLNARSGENYSLVFKIFVANE
ncbi:protein kinase [candidate division KSB1 bacterium]|nr:protein kinase [candidate division KSB1 bacterium]NIR70794.1 protein kinase [candidate division KSB1 bacterium]NIS27807.1 protein kinase [candidate division KSB1 bacterium]NIT74689.1 protein kinase [candidate division KSB1 bacterium]NIU28474.1 protein kinase [candidate division KSB1 bacterium]